MGPGLVPSLGLVRYKSGSVSASGRKHGEPWLSGTLVIGDPQENVDKAKDVFNVFSFFVVLSGRAFWKSIRAALPHLFGPV